MKPLQLVLGAVLVLLIGAVLLWYSLGPGKYERPQPLDPTTATSTSPPTAVTSSAPNGTVVPSTTTTTTSPPPPTTASGASNGNGNGGDAVPVPEPGSVTFTFQWPDDMAEPSPWELVVTSQSPHALRSASRSRRAPVQKRSKQPYQATVQVIAPGRHAVFVDIPGVGTWGEQQFTVRSGETTTVALAGIIPAAPLSLEVRRERDGQGVAFTARLTRRGSAGAGGGRVFRSTPAPAARVSAHCLPGEYLARVTAPGLAPVLRVIHVPPAGGAWTFELGEPATLSLTVRNARGEPSGTLYLLLRGSNGAVLADTGSSEGGAPELMTRGGTLRLAGAPLGRWTVEAARVRGGPFKPLGEIVLEPGKTTEQTFTYRD
ncbi:MAG: hypothetical protein ACYTGX_17975 [Planctomycetota bacterium]|jgi:hypothetical protein